MKKKIFTIIMSLALLVTMIPMCSLKAQAATIVSFTAQASTTKSVSTFNELKNALTAEQYTYIKLAKDIDTTSKPLVLGDEMSVTGNVTLDLNGHDLTICTAYGQVKKVINVTSGHLTIKDSTSDKSKWGTLHLKRECQSHGSGILVENKLTIESGNIAGEPDGTKMYTIESKPTATVVINEGNISVNFKRLRTYDDIKNDEKTAEVTHALYDEGGNITINGGTFDGLVALNGKCEINGGTFNDGVQLYANAKPKITAGIFHCRYREKTKNGAYSVRQYNSCNQFGRTYPDEGLTNISGDKLAKAFPSGTTITCESYKYYYKSSLSRNKTELHPSGTLSTPYTATQMEYLIGSGFPTITVTSSALNDMALTTGSGSKIAAVNGGTATATINPELLGTFTISAKMVDWYKNKKQEGTAKCFWSLYIYDNGTLVNNYIPNITENASTETVTITVRNFVPVDGHSYIIKATFSPSDSSNAKLAPDVTGTWKLTMPNAGTIKTIKTPPIEMSAPLTPGNSNVTASAAAAGYKVTKTEWFADKNCTTSASTFTAGSAYYAKLTIEAEGGYKFDKNSAPAIFCNDANGDFNRFNETITDNGSRMVAIVRTVALDALTWVSASKNNATYTIGGSALKFSAQAKGGDASREITYKFIAKKDGKETVKASNVVYASSTDKTVFEPSISFDDVGYYECHFEAKRGNVTIESKHFFVSSKAEELAIANQATDISVTQGSKARLWIKAVGVGVSYQWCKGTKTSNTPITGATESYFYPDTSEEGFATYICIVNDKFGDSKVSDFIRVTVTQGEDKTITPAQPIAAINGDAPNIEAEYPDKIIDTSKWVYNKTYNMEEGSTFDASATYTFIPSGYYYSESKKTAGEDYYYYGYLDDNKQKTPVIGTISYKWGEWSVASGTYAEKALGTAADQKITIPAYSELKDGIHHVYLIVENSVGTVQNSSIVNIDFKVSKKHEHTYAYAQVDKDTHTKYCSECNLAGVSEKHTMKDDICSLCGYSEGLAYAINVTGATASVTTAKPEDVVYLTLTAADGQKFDKWVGNVEVSGSAGSYFFVMPERNVSLAATYMGSENCEHVYGKWTDAKNGLHKRACSKCGIEDFDMHSFGIDGKCTANGCPATASSAEVNMGGSAVITMTSSKAKSLASKLTLVAKTSKTSKKSVKVKLSLDKNDKKIISQLKDAGYTIKYRYYRSTKKTKSYKSTSVKKSSSYTYTSGTKNKTYYYKAQVRVYSKAGKLVTSTKLSQCKYASRKWTKD